MKQKQGYINTAQYLSMSNTTLRRSARLAAKNATRVDELADSLPADSLPADSLPADSLPADSLPAVSLSAFDPDDESDCYVPEPVILTNEEEDELNEWRKSKPTSIPRFMLNPKFWTKY
jgi:hypothetical protein